VRNNIINPKIVKSLRDDLEKAEIMLESLGYSPCECCGEWIKEEGLCSDCQRKEDENYLMWERNK
jgi:hypothetical protein